MLEYYSLKDVKASVFGEPQAFRHIHDCLRAIANTVNNEKTTLFKYPADFEIWLLAKFDESTGEFSSTPTFIMSVANLKEVANDNSQKN